MYKKKEFFDQYIGKRLRINRFANDLIILVMCIIVLYDSFTHDLPFYYILFTTAGILIGRIYRHRHKVYFNKEQNLLDMDSGFRDVLIVGSILLIRFLAGEWIMNQIHVIWISDSLYLFLIGLHFYRVRMISRQIDEIAYDYILKTTKK